MPSPQDESERLSRTDRELLLSLRTEMKFLSQGIKDLKDDLEKFIEGPRSPIWDHEKRLRRLKNFRWWILGAIAAAAGLASLIEHLWR